MNGGFLPLDFLGNSAFRRIHFPLAGEFRSGMSSAAFQSAAPMGYKRQELLRLYRNLLKNAYRFPLASRRDVVTEEVKAAYRNPINDRLTKDEVDYKLVLGWERNAAIAKYAENMHWFHSRDQVNKEMLHHSQMRDKQRAEDMDRHNQVGDASMKTEEVTEFKSVMYNVNPQYYHKVDKTEVYHELDVWRCRGSYGSDMGGPRQRFYIKRYKPAFPQGW